MKDDPEKKTCHKCAKEYFFEHPIEECADRLYQQLTEARSKVSFWKDGWFNQREATGKMAWEVPNPYYLKGVQSPYFQQQWKRFVSFAQQLVRDGLIPLDSPVKEVIVRSYMDPFENIEE